LDVLFIVVIGIAFCKLQKNSVCPFSIMFANRDNVPSNVPGLFVVLLYSYTVIHMAGEIWLRIVHNSNLKKPMGGCSLAVYRWICGKTCTYRVDPYR
jgi:hypothetical protein